jgi:Flp pilus assembly pilin Flp
MQCFVLCGGERRRHHFTVSIEKQIWPGNVFVDLTPNRRKEEDMTTIARYTKKFAHYLRNNRAVSALEYAILVGLIAVAIGAALNTLGGDLQKAIEAVGDQAAKVKGKAITN